MVSDLLLEFLQKLVSAGDVLGSLDWVLVGLGFAWRWHGLRSPVQLNSIQVRVERTLLSAAVDLALARRGIGTNTSTKNKIKTKTNTKSGGQECPPYTLFASPRGWALRLFFKDRKLDLLLNWINSVH